MSNISASLDDIAAKLPQIKFKQRKKRTEMYIQRMQSQRGGRQFLLQTSEADELGNVTITLVKLGWMQEIFVGSRTAIFGNTESITRAIKSLEHKAGCKLYYVLLISTDGEYL